MLTQSVSLPPKTVTHERAGSTSIACLRDSEVQSVSSDVVLLASTTNGRTPLRVAMMSRGDKGVCRSRRSLIWLSRKSVAHRHIRVRIADPIISCPDHRSGAHRDHVEQPLGVVEECQYPFVLRQPRHDQVDALGEHDLVLGSDAVRVIDRIHERAGGVDDDLGLGGEFLTRVDIASFARATYHLHAWPNQTTHSSRRSRQSSTRNDEPEHEPGIVVDDVRVGILDAAQQIIRAHDRLVLGDLLRRQHARCFGEPVADQPVARRAQTREPRLEWGVLVEGGHEPDLFEFAGRP